MLEITIGIVQKAFSGLSGMAHSQLSNEFIGVECAAGVGYDYSPVGSVQSLVRFFENSWY